MRNRSFVTAILVCGLAALGVALVGIPAPAADKPAPSPAKAAAQSTRAPDATERAAMLDILKVETAPARAAWISYSAGSAEGQALADALAGVFREAGWKVEVNALGGMVLKPGVSMLIADEEAPTWVETALQAMGKSGIEVKSASGYRSYFDEKKKENPAWPGVPLAKDAAFVIVVGPEPKS